MNDRATIAGPIDAKQRIVLLDGLRGFALLGILLANMSDFIGWPYMSEEQDAAVNLGWPDTLAHFLFETVVHGKFYALFSLMFGIGFAIQLQRLEGRGLGVSRYARRLFILILFGVAHIIFFWVGDILMLYGLMGFLLLALRGLSDRALLVGAALLWLFPIGWELLKVFGEFNAFRTMMPLAAPLIQAMGFSPGEFRGVELWTVPDYVTHLRFHVVELYMRFVIYLDQMRYTKVLGMFLIGLWVGRKGLHADPAAFLPLLRKVAFWGLVIGLPFAMLRALFWSVWEPDIVLLPIIAETAYCISVPLLGLAYAALAALAWQGGKTRFFELFSPIGRMALTNYIMQSLIQTFLFFGWGLGLMFKLPFVAIIPITAVIFGAQVYFSKWWLARYRFGPLEWLWRSLTYGKAQPMRLAAASAQFS